MDGCGRVTSGKILEMVKRQHYRCAITGRDLTPETATLDHIVPLSRGGLHKLDNVWVVHRDVNMMKGTLVYDEFVALCRDVVANGQEMKARIA